MSATWSGKPSVWPETIKCDQDGCTEDADLVEDEGGGYCAYCCPAHGMFAVQYDDDYDDDDEWDDFDDYEDD